MTTPSEVKVESAKPIGTLSQEEKAKRYAELRARMGESKFKVVGKPGIHYFWAAKEDSNEMVRLELIGYSVVKEPNAADVLAGKKKPEIAAAGLRQDGTYSIGDVILTQCDQDVYDFCMLENEQKSEDAVRAAKESFKVEAEKSGVPTFEFSK